ncbi:MAG: hypothetical protein U5L45_15235 [Saprospiraceae bacterium]|nr:hypothetical protein [Saprospiraceae bacterium]
MILVKGGIRALISNAATPQAIGAAVSDEKRRQRPGGGVNTN